MNVDEVLGSGVVVAMTWSEPPAYAVLSPSLQLLQCGPNTASSSSVRYPDVSARLAKSIPYKSAEFDKLKYAGFEVSEKSNIRRVSVAERPSPTKVMLEASMGENPNVPWSEMTAEMMSLSESIPVAPSVVIVYKAVLLAVVNEPE
jgi:hypothetical protein